MDNHINDELVVAAKNGQPEAYKQLLIQIRPILVAKARQLDFQSIRIRSDSSDLAQEGLAEIIQNFPRFRGSTGAQFVAWAKKILVSSCLEELRKQNSKKRKLNHDVHLRCSQKQARTSPTLAANKKELREAALAQLKPLERECYELYLHGMTVSQISVQLGLPLGTVKTRIRKGLMLSKRLWDSINDERLPESQEDE